MSLLLALAALGAGASDPGPQEPAPAVPQRILMPPGPAAELVAALEDLEPAPPPAPWPVWDDLTEDGWGGEAPWRRWVELVRAEVRAERPDPERRAALALLARQQGRDPDAWRHLVAAGPTPSAAGVLPALFPGVPPEHLGAQGALPDGVLLSPALPPATHDPRGTLRELVGRIMEHRDVRVAGAVLSLRVLIEGDGVQVDVKHRSGGPVRVRLRAPVPPGVNVELAYVDWERIDDPAAQVEYLLSAEEPDHTFWGRFLSRRDRWPAPLPREGVARPRASLAVVVSEAGARAPHLARFAEALSELFETPCDLRTAGAPASPTLLEPIQLRFEGEAAGAEHGRRLAAMISLLEQHALAGRP